MEYCILLFLESRQQPSFNPMAHSDRWDVKSFELPTTPHSHIPRPTHNGWTTVSPVMARCDPPPSKHSDMVDIPRGISHPSPYHPVPPSIPSDVGNEAVALLVPPLRKTICHTPHPRSIHRKPLIPETPTVISTSVKAEDRLFSHERIDRLPALTKEEDRLLS